MKSKVNPKFREVSINLFNNVEINAARKQTLPTYYLLKMGLILWGDPALTKRICGFDSRLLLGPVIPKMGVVSSCMVLTMKEGPRNITGRPSVSIM